MEKEGVRDRPALHVENRSKGEQRASFFKVDSPKGNACDYWHPPECSVHQKRELRTSE